VLKFEDVTFRYAAATPPVLCGFSMTARTGTITALLGPNGTGKTTALRLAAGWLRPSAGEIRVDSRRLGSYDRSAASRLIGLVPQGEMPPFEFSILDYVLMGRTPHLRLLAMPGPADVASAHDAIAGVGLGDMAMRPISTLSAGQRQLVLVARALAQHPRLLLMDEPSAQLDMANRRRLSGILRENASGGTAIVLTTHEPDFAAATATHLALMHDGRVLASGLFGDVFREDLLRATYGIPLTVVRADDRPVVFWS
jgi:iron complex transport system ATP-binding protein